MHVTEELFVIRGEQGLILYSPLDATALQVNENVLNVIRAVKNGLELKPEFGSAVKALRRFGIIRDCLDPPVTNCLNTTSEFAPTSVTLLPTFNCNLRCTYCYSHGGEDSGKRMEFQVAKSAIDLVLENCTRRGIDRSSLSFHGGGEPLLHSNIDLLQRTVTYYKTRSKELSLGTNVFSGTNGIISSEDLAWIVSEFDSVTVSLDGPADIQNSQRPKPGNRASYNDVLTTISYLEERGFSYGIRTTITSESVDRMSEIVRLFASISPSSKNVQVEPLHECGRCKTTNARAPEADLFFRRFVEARELAKDLGVELYYSGARLNSLKTIFCGASGDNFFVTPEGDVVTCLEAARRSDPSFCIFNVGSYCAEGKFEFNEDRIGYLQSRTIDKIPYCRNCFAKHSCAGDCPAKVRSESGDIFDTSKNQRCSINREVLLYDIQKQLKTASVLEQ